MRRPSSLTTLVLSCSQADTSLFAIHAVGTDGKWGLNGRSGTHNGRDDGMSEVIFLYTEATGSNEVSL